MNSADVPLQAALVLRSVRTVRAAFVGILAALNLQMIPHVPEPTVSFVAPGTPEASRFPVQTFPRLRRRLRTQDDRR